METSSLFDQIFLDFYQFLLFGVFVYFSLFFVLTLKNGIRIRKGLNRVFLALCFSSAGYSFFSAIILFPYIDLKEKFDIANFFISLSNGFYLMCMTRYLALRSKYVSICSLVLFFCGAISLLNGLLSFCFGFNFFFIDTPMVTKNLILNQIGVDQSPHPIFGLYVAAQVLIVFSCSGFFAFKIFQLGKVRSEIVLICGLFINLLLQFNEASLAGLSDVKYIMPILSLSYLFETYRLYTQQQKEAIKKFLTLEGELVEATLAAELSVLAGGVLHDIRNPLSKVMMSIASLRKKQKKGLLDKELYLDKISQMEVATNRMHFIANKYLDILRGTNEPKISPVELRVCVKEAVEMCEERLKVCQIDKLEVFGDVGFVSADESALIMCLTNLIHNAVDAIKSQESPWIRIHLQTDNEGKTEIKIQDSGKGIPLEVVKEMFKRHFSTKKQSGGTGLGLSMVRELLKKQQATIDYKEENGHTTFLITLPAS